MILCWGIADQVLGLTLPPPHLYYVSPQGSDTSPGTEELPFATIQKAVDAMSLHQEGNLKVIYLSTGTYTLTEPIRITSPLQLQGKEGAQVTISGGRKITGFTPVDGNTEAGLVVADIPDVKAGTWDFRDLYVNDQRAIRARHPNTGFFRIARTGADRRTNFTYNEGDLKNWQDLANVELVFMHDWSTTRCPIKEIDEAERRLTVPHRIGWECTFMDFFYIDNNILSNKEGVPMIRSNSMLEETIEKIGNRDLPADSPEIRSVVERIGARAGRR